jgi:hypothetical protein
LWASPTRKQKRLAGWLAEKACVLRHAGNQLASGWLAGWLALNLRSLPVPASEQSER